jgi:radical SAM-linked protein
MREISPEIVLLAALSAELRLIKRGYAQKQREVHLRMAKALRFKFSRSEQLKYIAHLDILRVFERALKRSKLPLAYTQGFNPRQKLVFGLPMSIGLTSEAEYADIEFEQDVAPEDFIRSMNSSLPEGIRILEAVEQNINDNIMNQITAAKYEIGLETREDISQNEMDNILHRLLSRDEIFVLKKTKKGMRPVNIRPWIYSLSIRKKEMNSFLMEAFLSAGAENNLRADLLMQAFNQETGLEAKTLAMHRKALYASSFNKWQDPFEVANG